MTAEAPPTYQHIGLIVRLCLLGFLINCKPSEPFLTAYLLDKNFTEAELAVDVWPWSTFGAFVMLLPFGLLAESIGSRRVIFIGLLCREITRVLLIFATSLPAMALMQCTYAAGVAADAIYFAYVYTVAPPTSYAMLTSLVLAAYHTGNVFGALVGQVLVWSVPGWSADETPLFLISWVSISLGLVAFAWLPPPNRALPPSLASLLIGSKPRQALAELSQLWKPLESRRWLLWFGLAGCGDAVVLNYFQLQLAQTSAAGVPYGALEAAIELALVLGALGAFAAAPLVRRRPATFLSMTSLVRAAALGGAAVGASAGVASVPFALNIVASAVYALQRAAGSSALAQAVVGSADRLPVLFATNTLVAYAGAAALGWAGAAAGWEAANSYYYCAAVLMAVLAVCAPLVDAFSSADEERRPFVEHSSSACCHVRHASSSTAAADVLEPASAFSASAQVLHSDARDIGVHLDEHRLERVP